MPTRVKPQFIVGEVSKNWINGMSMTPLVLSEAFEQIVNINHERGYRLHAFSLHRLMTVPGELNETIIAVFELAK